jgi:hypothetical protein
MMKSRRVHLSALLVAILFVVAPGPRISAHQNWRLVFFGDSLSDAGNHFIAFHEISRRPFEPVPREVQEGHRHPRVDDRCARDDSRRQAVLPGTGKEHERVAGGETARQRRGELVGIFSDACARSQGGPIVKEDTHARPC